jgi:hypothetical protein
MGTRQRQLLLGVVVVVLAAIAYLAWPVTSVGTHPASNRQAPSRVAQVESGPSATDVHLGALDADRVRPEEGGRDLFRFKVKAAPPPPPPRNVPSVVTEPAPAVPSGPPPPPPITLKYIGVVERSEQKQKIAILSDGRNLPFYGREGDIIEGRYRILKIGVESIDLAYVDGRGRQTIRIQTGG